MKCRVCGNEMVCFDKMPHAIEGMLDYRKEKFSIPAVNMDLHYCLYCTHIQSEYVLESQYYDNHNNSWEGFNTYYEGCDGYSNKMEKISDYILNCSVNKKACVGFNKFLDIGCGTGRFIQKATQYFNYCVGVEPSCTAQVDLRKCDNVKIVKGYFGPELGLSADYDAFSALMVFEHLEEPSNILKYAYDILLPGGIGVVNVPNGNMIFQKGLYQLINLQHINYFSSFSLALLAKNTGFEILEIENDIKCVEYNLYVRKPTTNKKIHAVIKEHKEALCEIINGGEITIWGAGNKTVNYINMLDGGIKFNYIIDSDSRKEGLYLSGVDIPIRQPTNEILKKSKVLLILASSYNDEILKKLKDLFNYKGRVIYFVNNEIFVEDMC